MLDTSTFFVTVSLCIQIVTPFNPQDSTTVIWRMSITTPITWTRFHRTEIGRSWDSSRRIVCTIVLITLLKITELVWSPGFLGTLKESQARKAIWRVIGWVYYFVHWALIGKSLIHYVDNRSYSPSLTKGAYVGTNILYSQVYTEWSYLIVDLDAWDGYRANRLRVLDFLYNNSIDNSIILSGDSHANWVSDLASTWFFHCVITMN